MKNLEISKYFIQKLNNMKIRDKLIMSFICVVFVPILIIGFILTNELRQITLNNATNQMSENMERVKVRTSEVLKTPYDISIRFLFDSQFKWIMNTQYETTYDVVKSYQDFKDFEGYMLFYNELNNIRFYMGNPTLLENWQFFYLNQSIKETEWYQEVYQAQGKVGWYYIEDETKNNDKYLSFVRQIEFKDFETHGMMVITINPSYLHQILEQESFDTMIIDGNNVIIAARNSNLLGTHLEELDYNIIPLLTNTNRIEEIVINGKTSKIIVEDLN